MPEQNIILQPPVMWQGHCLTCGRHYQQAQRRSILEPELRAHKQATGHRLVLFKELNKTTRNNNTLRGMGKII